MKADFQPDNRILTVRFDSDEQAAGFFLLLNHNITHEAVMNMGMIDAHPIRTAIRKAKPAVFDIHEDKRKDFDERVRKHPR